MANSTCTSRRRRQMGDEDLLGEDRMAKDLLDHRLGHRPDHQEARQDYLVRSAKAVRWDSNPDGSG